MPDSTAYGLRSEINTPAHLLGQSLLSQDRIMLEIKYSLLSVSSVIVPVPGGGSEITHLALFHGRARRASEPKLLVHNIEQE